MSLSRDLKDFVAAFQAGYKMIPSQTDEEYKKAQTEYQKALTAKLGAENAAFDPELERRIKEAEIAQKQAYAKYYAAGGSRYRGVNTPEVLTPEQEDQLGDINAGYDGLEDPSVPEFAGGGAVTRGGSPWPQQQAIPTGQTWPQQNQNGPWPQYVNTQRNQQRWPGQPQRGIQVKGMDQLPAQAQQWLGQMFQAGQTAPGQFSNMKMLPWLMSQFKNARTGAPQQSALPMFGGFRKAMGYAHGGLVEDDAENGHAIPQTAAAATPAPAPVTQEVTPPEAPVGFSYMAVEDAVKGAYEVLDNQFKMAGAVPTPDGAARGEQAKKAGMGAVDPKQLAEVDKAAGIEGLPEERRNMARLARVWEFYNKQGLPNRAKAAAADLLQTYRMISNRFDAIAQAAAEQGDVDGALDAKLRAYSYIPDGKEVKVQKTKDGQYQYQYTDEKTGKVVSKGVMTPEQVLGVVTNGLDYDDLVMATGNKDEIAQLKADKSEERTIAREDRAEKRAIDREKREEERKSKATPSELREFLAGAEGTEESPYRPMTKQEFDAIPDGKWVVNPANGVASTKNTKRKKPAPAKE